MANIIKSSYAIIKSSNYERVKQIYNEREQSKRALQLDFDRGLKAWQAYMGFYGEQWPNVQLMQLHAEKRYAYQFNIIRPKVDTMAGAIITDLPDPDWTPVEGQPTTGTDAIKETFYSDKELTNWRVHLIELIQAGLIHNGWIEMVETTKYHPLGNIGLNFLRDGSGVPSAYWKSNDDRKLEKFWKSRYFNPEKLKFKYEKSSAAIEAAIQDLKLHGMDELDENAAEERRNFEGRVGSEYEVIEELWLEHVKTERLVGRKENETVTIPFPITIKDKGEEFEKFVQLNQIDISSVNPYPYTDIISHKTAVCPSLDPTIMLYDKKTRVQVKGLPVYHFTTRRHEGKDMGMCETIMDMQAIFNKRITLENELVEKTNGGMKIWNKAIFRNPKEKTEIKDYANKPGHNMFANIDDVQKVYEEIQPNAYPSQVMSQIELIYNQLLPLVSGVSDAWSAEGASNDSGILYERKVQMNKIGTLLMDEGVKHLINNIGEGYMYQWPITYGGMEREITTKGGKGKVVLNEKLQEGFVRNSVEHLPRHKVIVTEKVDSPTRQQSTREMMMELMKQINPETNPISFQNALRTVFETLNISDDEKEKFMADLELELAAARTQMTAQIASNTAATSAGVMQDKQAQMQLQKMGAGPPQAPQQQITAPEEQVSQVEPEQEEETMLAEAEI